MTEPSAGWEKTLLGPRATVREAIQSLNRSSMQIVLVVDSRRRLLGTVTDGDIRRCLFEGRGMDSCIAGIMKKNPRTIRSYQGSREALTVMKKHQLSAIPGIDDLGRVCRLHLLGEFLSGPRNIQKSTFVIMAGGFGKRLRPFTHTTPKPMIKVQGKPILEHILERAIRDRFGDFVITTHHLGSKIRNYFGTGQKWGVRIRYVHESKPLGTAGSLRLVKPSQAPVIITNGDILADISYADMIQYHQSRKARGTMAVKTQVHSSAFGIVEVEGLGIRGFREKPVSVHYINAGIYVLEPEVLRRIPMRRRFDMPQIFQDLISRKEKTVVYPIHEPWADVGGKADLAKVKKKGLKG